MSDILNSMIKSGKKIVKEGVAYYKISLGNQSCLIDAEMLESMSNDKITEVLQREYDSLSMRLFNAC